MLIVADPLIAGCAETFGRLGTLRLVPGRTITRAALAEAEILLVRSVTRVDAALLSGTPVRFVGSATAGTDHVDLDYLRRAGIDFAHAPGSNAAAVAEYVLCAILSILARDRRPDWSGLTAGIIGHGHAGTAVARKLGVLGIECLLNDPPRAAAGDPGPYVDLATALAADIVSLHVPLTESGPYPTRHLLDAIHIAALRPDTILINAARGGIIDETALRARLANAADLRVVLDCWCGEPAIDQQLLELATLATPHIAGHTIEARLRGTRMLYDAYRHRHGLAADPEPGVVAAASSIEVPGDGPELDACCRRAYDIAADSARLKDVSGDSLAGHFDRCRQDRQRHEFGHYR